VLQSLKAPKSLYQSASGTSGSCTLSRAVSQVRSTWYCIKGPTRQILCHVSWHVKQMLQSMLTLAVRCDVTWCLIAFAKRVPVGPLLV
jgi:hypothetical protein